MEYAGYIFTGKSGQYDVSGLSKSGKLQSRSENRKWQFFLSGYFFGRISKRAASDRKAF